MADTDPVIVDALVRELAELDDLPFTKAQVGREADALGVSRAEVCQSLLRTVLQLAAAFMTRAELLSMVGDEIEALP